MFPDTRFWQNMLAADGQVESIGDPDDLGVRAAYPIAVLTEAPNPGPATEFVAFVRSGTGRSILSEAGFGLP